MTALPELKTDGLHALAETPEGRTYLEAWIQRSRERIEKEHGWIQQVQSALDAVAGEVRV